MKAQRKGAFLSVRVDDELVRQEVSHLQNSLIGRLSLASGDTPYALDALVAKLGETWGIQGYWNLIPLGRGYYNIQIPCL